jgi:hypothetical protein
MARERAGFALLDPEPDDWYSPCPDWQAWVWRRVMKARAIHHIQLIKKVGIFPSLRVGLLSSRDCSNGIHMSSRDQQCLKYLVGNFRCKQIERQWWGDGSQGGRTRIMLSIKIFQIKRIETSHARSDVMSAGKVGGCYTNLLFILPIWFQASSK